MAVHYCLQAMRGGELITEGHACSQAASTPELARRLARPTAAHDALALVQVETIIVPDAYRRPVAVTILDIIDSQSDGKTPAAIPRPVAKE